MLQYEYPTENKNAIYNDQVNIQVNSYAEISIIEHSLL